MSTQPPNAQFRQAVRGFYAWLASLVFAGVTPLFAIWLINTGTLAGRIVAVVLGSVSWIPMAFVVAWIIRAGDEFQRRIHLVALALAFGSALLLLAMMDWLVRAEFIWRPPLQALWLAFAVIWVIWLFIVKHRFERES
jgi:hypothetical protein